MQGSPRDLANSGVDFAKLVGINETDNDENPNKGFRKMSRQMSTFSASSISLNGSADGSEFDDEDDEGKTEGLQLEESSKGKVKGSIALNYFRAGSHWSILVVLGILFLVVQLLASAADYWVSIW